VAAGRLEVGDIVVGYDGQHSTIEDLHDTGAYETVYNVRIADYHTYFVGGEEWGFSVWAHNTCYEIRQIAEGKFGLFNRTTGEAVTLEGKAITANSAEGVKLLATDAAKIDASAIRLMPDLTKVPTVAGGEFQRWFNSLTSAELDQVWQNPTLRKAVESRLRSPGGFHEWLPVSRAPKFKEWGITAEQIEEWRTATSQVKFRSPPAPPGGMHSAPTGGAGPGATTFHNKIIEIADTAPDFATFRTRLQALADEWLVGGSGALPVGLRP
jgi:hypothetical protein